MNRSLQTRLSVWLSGAIVAVALIAGTFSFVAAFDEAIEMQDHLLTEMAALVSAGGTSSTQGYALRAQHDVDPEARIAVWSLPSSDSVAPAGSIAGAPAGLVLLRQNGLQTATVGNTSWRLYASTDVQGHRFAVSQRTAVRTDVARSSAWRTLIPLAVLIPILLLLVALLVGRMFRPVKAASESLDRRTDQDTVEIDIQSLPSELRPFVAAINGLLARIALAMDNQRRFIADAAHELRSPMTALSLQAERASQAFTKVEALERVAVLRTGLNRALQLLDQLLNLARAQMADKTVASPIAVRSALTAVLEDLMPLAQDKDIDLGVTGDLSATVRCNEADLRTMVRNLVENAIRYTPPGGRVELTVNTGDESVSLHVDDSGPGIDPADRERVFDAFYRVVGSGEIGSGLGLSIVRTLASRSGAQVALCESSLAGPARGLRASLTFSSAMATLSPH